MTEIQIDKEFAALIPQLSQEERRQLEENIVEHGGARDPLVVWRVAPDEMSEDAKDLLAEGGELNKEYRSCHWTDEEIEHAAEVIAGESDIVYPHCCIVGRTEHWALVETTGDPDGSDYHWVCRYTGDRDSDADQMVLLDGHNRYEICTRLDLPFEVSQVSFFDRSHAEEWIIRNQFGRRNLSAYVRTQLALRLEETIASRLKKNKRGGQGGVLLPKKSAEAKPETRQEIAKVANVSHDTVAKVKKIDAAEKAGKVDAETVAMLRTGEVSINRVVRDLKEQETEAKRESQKVVAISRRQHVDGLYLGDFRKIGDKIPDASVDLIFTDPPYDRKAIELFEGLGEFAARVLRPGGSLIAYVGHIQLPDALADLSQHLRYWWTCGCFHAEAKARMTEYGIIAGWKPIVWFVKETRGDKQTFITDVVTGAREKSHHAWQQAVSEARYFIDLLTQPDDFIVDPFCGGGTTPVACIQSGRKWAAFEIDEANFSSASSRIKEVMDDQTV